MGNCSSTSESSTAQQRKHSLGAQQTTDERSTSTSTLMPGGSSSSESVNKIQNIEYAEDAELDSRNIEYAEVSIGPGCDCLMYSPANGRKNFGLWRKLWWGKDEKLSAN